MKNSQKGFAVSILIAVIAVLAIGGGIYIYSTQKTSVPSNISNGNDYSITLTMPKNGDSFVISEVGDTNISYSWAATYKIGLPLVSLRKIISAENVVSQSLEPNSQSGTGTLSINNDRVILSEGQYKLSVCDQAQNICGVSNITLKTK